MQMALMNRRLFPDVETVFMMPADIYGYIIARLVKEVFVLGGNVWGSYRRSKRACAPDAHRGARCLRNE